MSLLSDYSKAIDNEDLNITMNDLGLVLNDWTMDDFAKLARMSGDDEQPPGSLVLRQYQLNIAWAIVQAVLTNTKMTIIVEMPRQSGKTTLIDQTIPELCVIPPMLMAHVHDRFRYGFRAGIFGPEWPKARRLRDKCERVLSSVFYRDVLGVVMERDNQNLIRLSCNSSILVGTASDRAVCPEGLSLHLAIIEEAQAVTSMRIVKSIRPMLAATKGVLVLIGTYPHDPKEFGLFKQMIDKAEDFKKVHGGYPPGVFRISLDEVFNTPGTQIYREFVLGEIEDLGYDHPAIQSQYFGRGAFIKSGITFIEGIQMLKPLRNTVVKGMKAQWNDVPVYVGIDIAKKSDDTVVTVYEPSKVVNDIDEDGNQVMKTMPGRIRGWLWLQGTNYKTQVTETKRFLSHYNVVGGLLDSRGPGEVFLDYLHSRTDDKLPPYRMVEGDEPTESEIDAEWQLLYQGILNKDWAYPKNNIPERHEFERQFVELVRKKRQNGSIKIDHPDREGAKSDFPVSFRMARKAAGDWDLLREWEHEVEEEFSKKKDPNQSVRGVRMRRQR
jgi:hypothetical protein